MRKLLSLSILLGLLISSFVPLHAQDTPDNLHVPSPVWEDQIIYFIMTDRFNDGDPTNNDQGMGEYDPADDRKYSGGDLQGIIDQLDYIQSLGATAIWITPPVANQWWDPLVNYGGYHGYWAENFKEVDAHLGTLADYQALSDALHERGMYLIQDIVTNHTGNFFTYREVADIENFDPVADYQPNPESVPVTAPSQSPFDQNNITDDQAADIYHWTPPIEDYNNRQQALNYQLSDLDDLNTENPVVVEALKDSYTYWIEEVGVDGFRIDTVLYVDHPFWNSFIHDEDGVNAAAAATGRDNFLTFGEAFIGSDAYSDTGDRVVASYLGTPEQPEIGSMLNFPLHFTINRIFAEGMPTDEATYRLNLAQELYPNPAIMPVFVDNHDVARFLSKGSIAGLKQAMLFLMTIPGIPVIYYGTEQAFTEQRAAMFAEGAGADGIDHFNQDAEMYQHIQTLANLRTADPVFTRGTITMLQDSALGAGVLAYQRDYEGETALVLFNTADQPTLMVDLETGLPAGTVLELVVGLSQQEDIVVGADGRITTVLAAREGLILKVSDQVAAVEPADLTMTVETALDGVTFSEDIALSGTVSEPNTPLQLLINNNAGQAIDFTADAEGNWNVTLPITGFPPGEASRTLRVYAPEQQVASAAYPISTNVVSQGFSTTMYDPAGDDLGPENRYALPTDESFGDQLDIRRTQVTAFGSHLEVAVEMGDISTLWSPQNGFDHVLFNVFIDVPGQEGVSVLPTLNAAAPAGFAWDYQAFIEGWNNRVYAASGASATAYGEQVNPAPEIMVDKDTNTIKFLFSAETLGNPETLDGTQVYITTWDWDGTASSYRGLTAEAGQWTFGGGDPAVDPLILDQTDVITLTPAARLSSGDPAGDDAGTKGNYTLPTDASFGEQLDILEAGYSTIGTNLEVYVQMGEITTLWTPQNGFDHVLFHVYVDLPNEAGATVLPLINTTAPAGIEWDYMAFIEGWNNRLYAAEGADAANYGTLANPAPEITVDEETNTIKFLFTSEALGNPATLDGTQVYITTWDWDGPAANYRGLTPTAGQWTFGGGDATVDSLILDDVLIGLSPDYAPPAPDVPMTSITLTLSSLPANTPADADFYLAGPFNNWNPNDVAYQFTPNAEGVPSLTLSFAPGTQLEYRITRGSWGNAEKFNPDDRFANHQLTVGEDDQVIEHEIMGWWDD